MQLTRVFITAKIYGYETCNPNAPISLYPSKVSGSISSFASFLNGSFLSY